MYFVWEGGCRPYHKPSITFSICLNIFIKKPHYATAHVNICVHANDQTYDSSTIFILATMACTAKHTLSWRLDLFVPIYFLDCGHSIESWKGSTYSFLEWEHFLFGLGFFRLGTFSLFQFWSIWDYGWLGEQTAWGRTGARCPSQGPLYMIGPKWILIHIGPNTMAGVRTT